MGKRLDGEIEALRKIVTDQRAAISEIENTLADAQTSSAQSIDRLNKTLEEERAQSKTLVTELREQLRERQQAAEAGSLQRAITPSAKQTP